MKRILSVGEATLDSFMFIHDANVLCTIDKQKCEFCMNYADKISADNLVFSVGGNAANTAVSFARLGLDSQLSSVRGDDWLGEQIHKTLDQEKIDCRYIDVEPGPSSYATAIVFQGERNLVIYHVPREYHLPIFAPVDWLYLTSLGQKFEHAYEQVASFVAQNHIKLSFNPGTHQLKAGVTKLKPILTLTEVLFVNKEEAQHLTELSATASFQDLSAALYEFGPKIVCITDGPTGAYAFDGHELLFCQPFPIVVVERTGAGDAYGAGFTAALLHDQTIGEAMRWGMANSAGVVHEIGPEAGVAHQSADGKGSKRPKADPAAGCEVVAVLSSNSGIIVDTCFGISVEFLLPVNLTRKVYTNNGY